MKKLLILLFVGLLATQTKAQTANAGSDVTIYLNSTNSATLNGSASSGSSFLWTEVSTDYSSGATITSPTSKTTTVTGLPQGVFYFKLKATTGGTSVYDSMKVIVNYAPLPKGVNYEIGIPYTQPAFRYMTNRRDDTTHYLTYGGPTKAQYYAYFYPDGDGPTLIYIERDRTNGMMLDSLGGKLYNTIENGYGGATSPQGIRYARSQISLANFIIDTNTTYVIEWKMYFPQSVSSYWYPTNPNWASVTMWDIHGNDDYSGQFGIILMKDSLCYSDGLYNSDYSDMPYKVGKLLSTSDMYNKTNTVRMTYREGSRYSGQKAFLKIEVNGVEKYFRNNNQVGKTPQFDYMKITGLYDFGNRLITPNDAPGRKFSLVTEDGSVYSLPKKPVVDAGPDQNSVLSSVALSGSANDLGVSGNGIITSYLWTKISGGSATISAPSSASTTITGLSNGTYQFKLKATDDSGIDGFDTVQVVVSLSTTPPPTVTTSGNQTVTDDYTSLYSTPAAAAGHSITNYLWTQTGGTAAGITSPTSQNTGITGLAIGVSTFKITVTQDDGQTAYVDVNITRNSIEAPTIDAGSNQALAHGSTVTLNAAFTKAAGYTATFNWVNETDGSGTFSNQTNYTTTVSGLTDGTYRLGCTITQIDGQTAYDYVMITISPATIAPPIVNAGTNVSIQSPTSSVSLSGSVTPASGYTATYAWTKISGPGTQSILYNTTLTPTITGLSIGTYVFRLTAHQSDGQTIYSDVSITVLSGGLFQKYFFRTRRYFKNKH